MEKLRYGPKPVGDPKDEAELEIRVVSATTFDEGLFWRASYLGRSLLRIPEPLRPALSVHFGNTGPLRRGLTDLYNTELSTAKPSEGLILVHDDVYIHDWFIVERAREALRQYQVIGVAGSVNPDLKEPSWGLKFADDLLPDGWQADLERSGAVNHFDYTHPEPTMYGPSPKECVLLDGVLLIVRPSVLTANGVSFDEQFSFQLYDLDLCRTALRQGLRLGTWPISITHNSGGGFDSEDFRDAARRYLEKWSG